MVMEAIVLDRNQRCLKRNRPFSGTTVSSGSIPDPESCFLHGGRAKYDHLISSIPLPDLVPMITETPKDVLDASQNLACTNVVLVNIGIARPEDSKANWIFL